MRVTFFSQAFNRTKNHAVERGDRQAAVIARGDRRKADGRGFRVAREDHLEQLRQLGAGWTVGHLVLVALHFARIEHVHINVDVDLVGEPAQAIELLRDRW